MAANVQSLRITDAFRSRVVAMSRQTLVALAAAWSLDPVRLEQSFADWVAHTTALVSAVQTVGVQLASAYVAAFVGSELGEAISPPVLDPAKYAGLTVDGRPLAEVLIPALFTVKARIADGADFEAASRAGQARALRNAGYELDNAIRSGLNDAMASEPRIIGWRRVTGGLPCGACAGDADGAIQAEEETLLVHPACQCTKEPVVADVADRHERPTGTDLFDAMSTEEQDAMFEGRGGAAKADLIRNGDATLGDLISHDRQDLAGRPPILTETSLSKLTG